MLILEALSIVQIADNADLRMASSFDSRLESELFGFAS